MKKFLLATVSLVAFASAVAPALAADMAVKAPPPAPLPVIYDWSGFYIGGNGGWGQSRNCVDFLGVTDGCRERSGGLVGGQFGYRWQARPAGVVPWGSAGSTASHRTGLPVLNTTICLWVTQTTRSRSMRLLPLFSTIGSARTWIWSLCASTTASAVTAHRWPRITDLPRPIAKLSPGLVRGSLPGLCSRGFLDLDQGPGVWPTPYINAG
jgi:hypothetical protein